MKKMLRSVFISIGMIVFLCNAAQCIDASGKSDEPGMAAVKSLCLPGTTILSVTKIAPNSFISPAGPMSAPDGPAPSTGEPAPMKHPAFVRIEARVQPQISIEVWLPLAETWNGKFKGLGNGGLAGSIGYRGLSEALNQSYAAASTDTGHTEESGGFGSKTYGSWALNRPDLIADYGHRAVHEMTIVAKAVIAAYYGKAPSYSYFIGCSRGGGEGLTEAQMYPDDYDGIVAGAPANNLTNLWLFQYWTSRIAQGVDVDTLISRLPAINQAVIDQLDALDGLKDGLIESADVEFDPIVLLEKPGSDPAASLSREEVELFRKFYRGLVDPFTGIVLMPGLEPGSEAGWGSLLKPFGIAVAYFKYMVYNDPDWDGSTFDFSNPETYRIVMAADEQLRHIIGSDSPDLYAFKRRGGKLILYHGLTDFGIPPQNTINYFSSVMEMMGGSENTTDFVRLFLFPGMGHCGGGSGCSSFDALPLIEEWVEKANAPDKIIGSRVENGEVTRTRPIYMYPNLSKWTGSGSTDDAANFVCRCSE